MPNEQGQPTEYELDEQERQRRISAGEPLETEDEKQARRTRQQQEQQAASEEETKPKARKTKKQEEEELKNRDLKPAELNRPRMEHMQLQEEVKEILADAQDEADKKVAKARKNSQKRQESMEELKAEQALVDDAERHDKERAHLQWLIANGSTTESELMELKMHPQHTNIGSGHGNPA